MIGSTVVNTHTGSDNVNLFEQEDLYKAVAAAETGDEESKRLLVSLMDSHEATVTKVSCDLHPAAAKP